MKRYNNDPAKSRSRALFREFLAQGILQYVKPQDAKVLHFPGADNMEVKEVYLPLGIPLENIVGVERDAEVVEKLRAEYPDMKLIDYDLEEYVAQEGKLNQHIVSLDFTQNLSAPTYKLITDVVDRIDQPNYTLLVAFQKSRENDLSKKMIKRVLLGAIGMAEYEEGVEISQKGQSQALTDMLVDLKNNGKLTDSRSVSISLMLFNMILGSQTEKVKQSFVNCLGKYYDNVANLATAEFLRFMGSKETPVQTKPGGDPLENIAHFQAVHDTTLWNTATSFIAQRIYFQIMHEQRPVTGLIELQDRDNLSFNLARTCLIAYLYKDQKRLRGINTLQRYRYVSESGTAMIGDMFNVRDDYRLKKLFIQYANLFDSEFRMRDTRQVYKLALKIDKLSKETAFGEGYLPFVEQRVDLGSSVKDLKKQKKKSKKKSRSKQETPTGASENEPSELELTKADILDFISSGVPPREIVEAYPEVSLNRVNALKFWYDRRQCD